MQNKELTDDIIAALKVEADGKPIWKKNIANQDFVFTYIDRTQYKYMQDWIEANPNIKTSDIEDKIVDNGLLWPQLMPMEWATLPAGVLPTLARFIQEKSYLDPLGVGTEFDNVEVEVVQDLTIEEKPDKDLLDKLKSKIKFPMSLVQAAGKYYVIRPMLRPEYVGIQKLPDGIDGEVEGCKKCIVWPENPDLVNTGAGVATVLAKQIMMISGFTDTKPAEEL